ncbi:MAG TPA: VapC toxin family PIN domain ribonuclease [Acidimicrobiaceae bacterium]|nr:VapC toxin family PIN domain ribonuclease [Acidimicrobiaceae bacterium]
MAKLIVVDASVLIGWLDDSDVHHAEAIDLLASVERFFVHPLTLAEVLVHPARGGVENSVLTRLEAIGMVVSGLPIDPVALARLRATSRLKMPDCVVLACGIAHDLAVATFDDSLAAAAANRGTSPAW